MADDVAVSALPVRLPVTLPVKGPKKFVAVTEFIPDIFVALSPIIFPSTSKSPVKVEMPRTFKLFVLIFAVLPTPVNLLPSPKYVTIPLVAVIIPEDTCTDPKVEIPLIERPEPTILFECDNWATRKYRLYWQLKYQLLI